MKHVVVCISVLGVMIFPITARLHAGHDDPANTTWAIIRHADRSVIANDHGHLTFSPALSPKGVNRSIALGQYIMGHGANPRPFPQPNFIFAQAPKGRSKHRETPAVRPIQTVLPTAHMLQGSNPTSPVVTTFSHPNKQPQLMALHVLKHAPQYAGKTILVCWGHESIPTLTYYVMGGWKEAPGTINQALVTTIFDAVQAKYHALGEPFSGTSRMTLTAHEKETWISELKKRGPTAKMDELWPSYDFDTVYVFQTDSNGSYVDGTFAVYPHQYPVDDPQTWDKLLWKKPVQLSYQIESPKKPSKRSSIELPQQTPNTVRVHQCRERLRDLKPLVHKLDPSDAQSSSG